MDHGINYKDSSVKRIIGIGEGLRDQDFKLNLLGKRIKEKWDVQLFATYSSTEMGATFSECPYALGGHAVANGIPVVSVNRVGWESTFPDSTEGIQFWGNSFIAGPQGELLAHESPLI